jgi:HK97 family phage portal protein
VADRSLVTLIAAGLGSLTVKEQVGPTTFGGRLQELSGVGFPREPFAGAWQRNIAPASTSTLLSFAPIYACVTRIAGDIAKLGIDLLSADADGIPTPAPQTSPFWTVLRTPNGYQNQIQFVTYWLICKLLWGNAYALKLRDGRGMVSALYLIDPRRVMPLVTPDGSVYYSIGGDYLSRVPNGMAAAPASEIIHDRGPTLWHPLVGVAPIYAAALSGTLGLQIQRNSATFFGNMSRPSGMLTAPGTIDEPTATRLKSEWEQNYSASNIGRLAVLGDGLKYEAMTIAAEQAQLAEQLGIAAVDCATAFGMPAYKINQGPMPTSNNVQALNQQYYSDCLQVHIEAIEMCLDEGLEVPANYCVEFNLEGLLRMDSATQMDVLSKGTKGGLVKPNEGRRRLRLPPVTGGDAVYMQQQDFSLAALAKRDAKPDPFGSEKPAPASAPPPPAPATSPGPSAAWVDPDAVVAKTGEIVQAAVEKLTTAVAGAEAAGARALDGLLSLRGELPEMVRRALADAAPAAAQEEDVELALAGALVRGFEDAEILADEVADAR